MDKITVIPGAGQPDKFRQLLRGSAAIHHPQIRYRVSFPEHSELLFNERASIPRLLAWAFRRLRSLKTKVPQRF